MPAAAFIMSRHMVAKGCKQRKDIGFGEAVALVSRYAKLHALLGTGTVTATSTSSSTSSTSRQHSKVKSRSRPTCGSPKLPKFRCQQLLHSATCPLRRLTCTPNTAQAPLYGACASRLPQACSSIAAMQARRTVWCMWTTC